jgi:hypothetical protein
MSQFSSTSYVLTETWQPMGRTGASVGVTGAGAKVGRRTGATETGVDEETGANVGGETGENVDGETGAKVATGETGTGAAVGAEVSRLPILSKIKLR